jgi:peptidoglycan/xylan/chitin deacetylase (PgdA/CDA1 family)
MLARRGIRATTFFNAQVADIYPSLTEEVLAAGWEFVGHGWFQRSLKHVENEEAEIRRCLERLERVTGKRTRGWFGAGGAETDATPDVLKAAGVEFTHDWVIDDLPCWITTKHGPLLSLPYTWELNDVPIWVVQSQSSDEMLRRLEATLAVIEREIETQPRIITFGLHPHIIGVPHRVYYMEKALDLLQARSDTVFLTSSEIADWFIAADRAA